MAHLSASSQQQQRQQAGRRRRGAGQQIGLLHHARCVGGRRCLPAACQGRCAITQHSCSCRGGTSREEKDWPTNTTNALRLNSIDINSR